MTEEKVLYLVKKLEKNIKKEIFSIFNYMRIKIALKLLGMC